MAYVRMCVCIWTCVCVCSFFRFAFVCSLEIHSDFDCWNTSVVSFQWVILYDERWNRRVTVPSSLISYHSTHTLSLTHPHKHTSNAGERLSLWKATVRKTWQQHPVQSTSPDKKSQQGMPITGNECFLNPMHPRIKSLGMPSHTHTQKTPASISRAVNDRMKEKIRQNQIASECKQSNICICVQYLTEFRMRKMHIKCHFLMKAKHAKQNVEFFYSIAWARAFNFHRFMPPSLFCSSLGSLILSLWGTAQQTHMNPPKWLFYIQFLILLSSWCNQIKTQMQTIHFHLFAWIRLTHAPNELLSSIITIRDAWYTHGTRYLLLNLLSFCLRIGTLQYQNTNGKNNNWNNYWVNHLSVKKTSNYFHTWAGRDFDEALHVWWCRCDWWIRWEIQRKQVNSLASTSTELRCNVKKIEEKPQKY